MRRSNIRTCTRYMTRTQMRGVIFVVAALAALINLAQSQRCAFIGQCLFDRNIDKSIPCAVNTPPSETLSTGLWNEFVDFCDDLAPTLEDRRLCCDSSQFQTLKKEMKSAEAIGMRRCSGCYRAFKNLMCQMTCSPRQGDFIAVNGTRSDDGVTGPALQEIVYALDRDFADALYTTCSGARSNLYVKLTTLMCGRYANRCSTPRFLAFLGSTDSDGGYSPFKVRHLLLSEADDLIKVTDYLGGEKILHRQRWKSYATCKTASAETAASS